MLPFWFLSPVPPDGMLVVLVLLMLMVKELLNVGLEESVMALPALEFEDTDSR
jgi:hypothetical protein